MASSGVIVLNWLAGGVGDALVPFPLSPVEVTVANERGPRLGEQDKSRKSKSLDNGIFYQPQQRDKTMTKTMQDKTKVTTQCKGARHDANHKTRHEWTRCKQTSQVKTRQIRLDKTRHDETRRDKTRRDETRRDKTRQDETRRDETRQDETRRDKRRTGQDRTEKDRKRQDRTGQDKKTHRN